MPNRLTEDWAWLDQIVGPLDESFVAAVREKVEEQKQPSLDSLVTDRITGLKIEDWQ